MSLSLIGVLGAARLVLRSNAGAWCGSVLMALLLIVPFDLWVMPQMPVALTAGVGVARTALLMAVFVRSGVLGWTATSVCLLVVAWGVPMDARPVPLVLLARRGRLRRPAGGRLLAIPQRAEEALDVSGREEE